VNQDSKADETKIRAEFGDYLSSRTDHVAEAWVEDVKSDTRIPSADFLPERLLKDHIPRLLEVLVISLKQGMEAAKEETEKNARQHGVERAGEGYSIRELIWEIFRLRAVLLKETVGFARGRTNELADFAVAAESIDTFLHDVESRSIEKFAEESRAALAKSDGARLRLLRSISHELRNMLNSVGFASTILDGDDEDALVIMKESLQRNCGHMEEVLDDLLGLSDILSPHRKISPAAFDTVALLHSLETKYSAQAADKGLKFSVSISDALKTVHGDAAKIEQVANILLANAIQYTSKGEVSLSFEDVSPQRWAMVIRDTGVGIARKDREHIFSEFYQVTPESPLRGSGLGLAMAVGLVDLLKGAIRLDSQERQGSTFTVELPKGQLAEPQA